MPADHALRVIQALCGEFEQLSARGGRPSIAPETSLRALSLPALHAVRSERPLMEWVNDNLLFRWFVGLSMDASEWDASTFSKNRDRLRAGDVAQACQAAVLAQPRASVLMSSEHFSFDGTLIQAWASHKSFRPSRADGAALAPPKPGGRHAEADWRAQKRSNETHASTTDPHARLARQADGQSIIRAHAGHVLMDDRAGLARLACTTRASGTAGRDASPTQVDRRHLAVRGRITPGPDKNDDAREHVEGLRARGVTPHIARNDHPTRTGRRRSSAIDGRTTRHAGDALSQVVRKRIEEVFGWIKPSARMRQTHHRGIERIVWSVTLAAAAANLLRLPALLRPAA